MSSGDANTFREIRYQQTHRYAENKVKGKSKMGMYNRSQGSESRLVAHL